MTQRQEIRERDVQGLKYLDQLLPMLERLHLVGCQRDKAGNRKLHYDEYCLLILLFLFNPLVRSLRGLQQASQLKNVQKKLKCPRASLGSLSEAIDVFDPTRLEGVIDELLAQLPAAGHLGRDHVRQALTAVDGSVVKTITSLADAAYARDNTGQTHCGWRFHTQFSIDRSVPTRMDVTSARNGGPTDERQQLREHLASDHCYVMDRWYGQFALWNDIVDHGSSYVCRIRDNSNLEQVIEERPVSTAQSQAGILRDVVVELGVNTRRPHHPVRVVLVKTTPHRRSGGRTGPPSDGIVRIATNLLDVPAEVISDIYKHRWAIELFFRFFKHVLGCRHLLSTDPVGIQIQAYLAIIACLLITLWTGGKPTLRTYEMVCFYLQGWADLDELTAHIEKLGASR